MFVKPAAGLLIPDIEHRDHLPPQGRAVNDSPYWQRLLRDRDVVVADPPVVSEGA
jgi:hypothetical protein